MPGDFLESDLPTFFNTSDFSHEGTWTPTDSDPETVNGIFDDLNMVIDPYTGEIDSTIVGTWTCAASDMVGAVQNETIVIDGTTYKLKRVPSSTSDYVKTFGLKKA